MKKFLRRIRLWELAEFVLTLMVLISSAVLCGQIISDAQDNRQNNIYYAELHHVKYGLLSVDEWKRQLSDILGAEIRKMDLSKSDVRALRQGIEIQLNLLIDEIYQKVKSANQGSAFGWLRQLFINTFIDVNVIKKGVPDYADTIVRELTKPKTKAGIRAALKQRLQQYLNETFESQVEPGLQIVLLRTHSQNLEQARAKVDAALYQKRRAMAKEAAALLILALLVFAGAGFGWRAPSPSRYWMQVLTLVILLVAGVATPMLNMEAEITRLSVVIMGHSIQFNNQVLFYQSKSVLDLFWLLIKHREIEMKLVGVLVITFSIFFPVLKLTSLLAYYYKFRGARENPVIKFFVFKSGKWSLADVLVVAIFMTYIGFNGIINAQFGILTSAFPEMGILTTNGTSLQPGFFLFLTYVLLALFLSEGLSDLEKPGKPRSAEAPPDQRA